MPPEGRLGFRGSGHVEGLVELFKVLVICSLLNCLLTMEERDALKWMSITCFLASFIIHCNSSGQWQVR